MNKLIKLTDIEFERLLDRHYDAVLGFHERRKEKGLDYKEYHFTREEHHEFFSQNGQNPLKIEMLTRKTYECENDIDDRDRWWIE